MDVIKCYDCIMSRVWIKELYLVIVLGDLVKILEFVIVVLYKDLLVVICLVFY